MEVVSVASGMRRQIQDRLLEFLISFFHIFQAEHLHRPFAFCLAANQLIDFPKAAWIYQTNLWGTNMHFSCILKN